MKEITSEQKYFNTLTEDKRIEYFKMVENLRLKLKELMEKIYSLEKEIELRRV